MALYLSRERVVLVLEEILLFLLILSESVEVRRTLKYMVVHNIKLQCSFGDLSVIIHRGYDRFSFNFASKFFTSNPI